MKPFVVIIAGGTGSGKTSLATGLLKCLKDETALISFDNYYKDQSHTSEKERLKINFDSPDAIDSELLCKDLKSLIDCIPIDIPIYDFETHTRKEETIKIMPKRVIIVEGILALHFKEVRELADLSIFVDVDDDERILRRILRDISERGRSVEGIVEQYRNTVKPMHRVFVEPTKKFADFIIQNGKDAHIIEILSKLFLFQGNLDE